MCHPEVPDGAIAPEVARAEIAIRSTTGEDVPTHVASPDGGGPPVLVIADIWGRSEFYEHLAGRLALAGFTAYLPDFFFRQGPLAERTIEAAFERRGRLDTDQAIADLLAVIDHGRAGAGTAVAGAIGFCLGGTFVLRLAAAARDLASVCFYGFPAAGDPPPLALTDRMEGPMLGFWGDQDEAVGMHNVEALATSLRARGVDFDHMIYPDIGHGFMSASRLDPGHEAYDAACDAWTKTIAFYRAYV